MLVFYNTIMKSDCRASTSLLAPCHRTATIQFSCLGFLAGSLAFLLLGCSKPSGASRDQAPLKPPHRVSVPVTVQSNGPVELKAVGRVTPFASIAVRSQMSGILKGVHFHEGDMVQQGQLIFTIDAQPYETDFKQATGALEKDLNLEKQAALEENQNAALLRSKIVSEQDYDESAAYAESLKASIAADRAAVESAELELSNCCIYAPITGRAGFLQVSPGNVVQALDMVLVTLNQTQPIFVDFPVSQEQLTLIRRRLGEGKALEVQAIAPGGQGSRTGEFKAIDNQMDGNPGAVQVRAQFPNADEALWPGESVTLSAALGGMTNAALRPSQQIKTRLTGN